MRAIEQHSIATNERQIAGQEAFHAKTETAYRRLATSVELSLKQSVADSARAASAALQPIMQTTMDGIARETAALHGNVEQAVARQLEGLAHGFEASSAKVADIWNRSLDGHREANEALVGTLNTSLERAAQAFDERAAGLVDGVSAHVLALNTGVQASTSQIADTWNRSLAKHEQTSDALVTRIDASMERFARTFEQRASTLVDGVSAQTAAIADQHAQAGAAMAAGMETALNRIAQTFEQRSSDMVDGVAARLDTVSSGMADAWRGTLAQQADANERLSARNEAALSATSAHVEQHAASLLESIDRSHADLRTRLEANNDARLKTWTDALGALSATLREAWQASNETTASRQQQICDTLERTASEMSARTEAHASATIAQIEGLVQTASEAPKAAAGIMAELRQKLSDSMARDTAMLDERARLLSTVDTLLDAVNHASTEQRAAVDALVTGSADLLERVGSQFTGKVEAETAKLNEVAAQMTGSAVEVASLSDAFGAAVQAFGTANETLVAHLERVEAALDKSLARSDDQLAYYVAQAREVIDLSMMSQKQIVEDLQRVAQRAVPGAQAA
jgi:DNA anti-recombination protein RmuC